VNPNKAAKALEHFGWALVKYAQKVQKNNPGMAAKWYGEAQKRMKSFKAARRELLGEVK
jgi:hypothetical protein